MFKHIAAACALILAASSVSAAQPNTYYAGADVGRTKINDVAGRDTSFGAFVGYQFHQNVALEGGYRRLADYDVYLSGPGGNFARGNARVDQAHLSVVGSLPIGESFSVYGRLGLNRLDARVSGGGFKYSDASTEALYGVGLSYAFSPAITARVEVQKPASDANNLNAGLSFQF